MTIAQLLKDAQPKADMMSNVVRGLTVKVSDSTVGKAAKQVAYNGLVRTVAVGLVVSQSSAMAKTKSVFGKMWDGVEKLAAEGEAAKALAASACPACGIARVNGVCAAHGAR